MSALGLVSTIRHPELHTALSEDIARFSLEYERYLNEVADVNRNRTPENRIRPTGRKACICPDLLVSLVSMKVFAGCDTVEDVTNTQVHQWMISRTDRGEQVLSARVEAAVNETQFKPLLKDPEGATLMFFSQLHSSLRKFGASSAIQSSPKALINLVIPKLQPTIVRDTVAKEHDYWPENKKYDLNFLQLKVAEISRESARYAGKRVRRDFSPDSINLPRGSKGEMQGRKNKKRREQARGNQPSTATGAGEERNSVPVRNPGRSADHSGGRNRGRKKAKQWTTPCLNPECTEVHPLKECKNTSEEQKDDLFRKLRADRKSLSVVRDPYLSEGRWEVLLHDKVLAIALGDIGADYSAVPRRLVQKLVKFGSEIPESVLDSPLKLSVAVRLPKNDPIIATSKVFLSIRLKLPCGPLCLRRVEFIVVENDMEEILLGRPLLKCLGFDLGRHLEDVRDKYHNADVSSLMPVAAEPESESLVLNRFAAYTGIRYNDADSDSDPIPLPNSIGASMGIDSEQDIETAITNTVRSAEANRISEEGSARISRLLASYRDILRIKLGPDPPARVEPMRIKLKQNHRPTRATQRRYAPPQREFISNTVRRLENIGAIYHNPAARWASPALAVPKPGSEEFRFTVDLRAPNSMTEPIISSMPNLECLLQLTEGSSVFAKIDLCHAYWQVPLHKDSQECMSIQTPLGVFTPRRVLQGSTDAGSHFQASTAKVFECVSANMLQWLDDFLLHAKDEGTLIDILETYFARCREFGLKIHAEKTKLFLRETKFCGRIIDGEGIRFDPRSLDALLNMHRPEKAGDLLQFICATSWMRNSIPEYATTIAPLHEIMELCYRKAKKRTKRAVRKISLSGLWGRDHDCAFQQIKNSIAQSVKLAHPKRDSDLCLFSDASESHWSSVLTQTNRLGRNRPIDEQEHDPLSFLSGSFKGASARWSIVEKEAFAIVESMQRLEYMVAGREVRLFTDHANLIYIFDPVGQNPGLARHTANKLMRWALKLSGYRYVIEHLSGKRNVWADMLTRWAAAPSTTTRKSRICRLMVAPITPSLSEELDWPSREDITNAQRTSSAPRPSGFEQAGDIVQDRRGVIWIPPDADPVLKLRILIAGHTGLGGHRGSRTSLAILRAHFTWDGMPKDVEDFCKSCLHCLSTSTGNTVPRPLGHSLHAEKPNQILHFDFCYIGKSNTGEIYILILKDDLSSYVWLFPSATADAEQVADALIEWFSAFGTVAKWISDQGSHFRNSVIRAIRERLHCAHHFTLAYCPWTNGSVEVVCRELIRAMRALLSEYQLPQRSWPAVVPVVQSILNNTPLQRLDGKCPLTAFTQLPADSPLLAIRHPTKEPVEILQIEEVRAKQLLRVRELQDSLDQIHRNLSLSVSTAREKRVASHNARTHVRACNFDVGDFVLCGKLNRHIGSKLSLRWYGPRRITKTLSDFLFEVEDLRTMDKSIIHGTRLKFFRNSSYTVTEELINQLSFQDGELCAIEKFLDLRERRGRVEVRVQWKGFEDEDPAWENIDAIRNDVPILLSEFLGEIQTNGTARQKRIASKALEMNNSTA